MWCFMGICKVGYVGIFDLMVSGVFVVGVNCVICLLGYLFLYDKDYIVIVRLGVGIVIDDVEGDVIVIIDVFVIDDRVIYVVMVC